MTSAFSASLLWLASRALRSAAPKATTAAAAAYTQVPPLARQTASFSAARIFDNGSLYLPFDLNGGEQGEVAYPEEGDADPDVERRPDMQADSTLRKRKLKMNKHKLRKRRKKLRSRTKVT
nr:secrectory protein [Plasmodiophora brassicae]